MPTNKQRKLAELIVENSQLDKPLNKGEMLEAAGYDPTTAKATPTRVMEQQGVQEALTDIGFDPDTAKKVVAAILETGEKDADKLKAADMIFKVHGTYAAEKSIALNMNVDARTPENEELETLRLRYVNELKEKLAKPL